MHVSFQPFLWCLLSFNSLSYFGISSKCQMKTLTNLIFYCMAHYDGGRWLLYLTTDFERTLKIEIVFASFTSQFLLWQVEWETHWMNILLIHKKCNIIKFYEMTFLRRFMPINYHIKDDRWMTLFIKRIPMHTSNKYQWNICDTAGWWAIFGHKNEQKKMLF